MLSYGALFTFLLFGKRVVYIISKHTFRLVSY